MKLDDAATCLAALAHPTRLATFRLLVEAGPQGLAAGVVAERVGVPPSTLSTHLAQLERAGLVSASRAGRQVIYAVEAAGVRGLLDFLVGDCCGGRPELCGIHTSPAVCPPSASPAERHR